MGYITYVTLAHSIVAFISSSLSIYYSVNVLFRKNILKKSVKLSPTITVYFGFVFLCALSSVAYVGYLIILWRSDGGDYNAYLLYIGGITPGLFYNTSSIAETFLCIERCISLLFSLKYTKTHKICFAILSFFGILAAMGISLITNKYFEIVPTSPKTLCQSFSCIAGASSGQSLFAQKIVLCLINIAFASILAYLIKKTIINSKNAEQMNKTVFILIVSTTSMELVPYLSAYIFFVTTGQQLFQYTGPFGSTVVVLNINLSVALYYKTFKKLTVTNNTAKLIAPAAVTTSSQNKNI